MILEYFDSKKIDRSQKSDEIRQIIWGLIQNYPGLHQYREIGG
jgi:hypothetical protein